MTEPPRLYGLVYRRSVEKDLRSLPKSVLAGVVSRIQALAIDPRPQGSVKLRGGDDLRRVRQGDYRVIYQIRDQEVIVVVIKVGHRREVYR